MTLFDYALGISDWIALVSITISIFLSCSWFKRRFLLNHFLSGQWEGDLRSKKNEEITIHCEMTIVSANAQCSGHLYYESRDGDGIFAKGIDKLSDYGTSYWLRSNIEPKFTRELHHETRKNKTQQDKKGYKYKFDVVNRVLADRVKCTLINAKDDTISGNLYRRNH